MEDRYDISVDIGEGSDMSCLVERVSCWGGKSFVDHDDTHDKVYELNRQMCDIDKHLSEAGYFRMICDGQIETRKKLIDMEEKKTKKMTKAEAFEYLKEKKVNAKDKDRVVQMKMFDCGIKWRCGEPAYYNFGRYLFIDNEGFLLHCGNDEEYWKRHAYEEISADDILSIEIVEEKKPSQEFVPYELTEMGKVQSTLDDGEVLIITRKQILKIQL